ncbi:MAG TPA: hypothetical protein DCE08_03075 [Ruminococcaceae bacterium]|nr:hypothetical protein [Oscillospiraceae bacterium]
MRKFFHISFRLKFLPVFSCLRTFLSAQNSHCRALFRSDNPAGIFRKVYFPAEKIFPHFRKSQNTHKKRQHEVLPLSDLYILLYFIRFAIFKLFLR